MQINNFHIINNLVGISKCCTNNDNTLTFLNTYMYTLLLHDLFCWYRFMTKTLIKRNEILLKPNANSIRKKLVEIPIKALGF